MKENIQALCGLLVLVVAGLLCYLVFDNFGGVWGLIATCLVTAFFLRRMAS